MSQATAPAMHLSKPRGSLPPLCAGEAWLTALAPSRWWMVFASVVVALLGLQLFYWTGPIGSDDVSYLQVALDPFQATQDASSQQVYARLMMWAPLRLTVALIGVRWEALLPWPLLVANTTIVAVGLWGLRWRGRLTALVTMCALGMVPIFLTTATVALPDMVGAMFGMLGLLLIAPSLLNVETHRPWWRCLAGGLLIGLGYSAKETTGLLYPATALFVLLWRTRQWWAWHRLLAIAVGSWIWLGIEAITLWTITGDPMFHLHAVRDGCRAYGAPVVATSWQAIATYATEYLRWLSDPSAAYGGWGLAYLFALLYAFRQGSDFHRLLLCCLLVSGVYLSIGTVDLTNFFPIYHQPRYLTPLLPLGALLVADAATALWRAGRVRRVLVSGVALVLCAGSLIWPDRAAGRMYHAAPFHAARVLLEDNPPAWVPQSRFVASETTQFRLGLLTGREGVPVLEPLRHVPLSAAEWQARHPNTYVLVLQQDRVFPDSDGVDYLGQPSYDELCRFELAGRQAPPQSRLSQLRAALGREILTHSPSHVVEVFYIPPAIDQQVALGSRQ